jgi:protein SCO1/2
MRGPRAAGAALLSLAVLGMLAPAACRKRDGGGDATSTTGPPADEAEADAPGGPKRQFGRDYFPNVTLRTHDNKQVRFYDDILKNKIVVVNLFYSQCTGSCPPVMSNLRKVQRILHDRIGKDIFMYSISIKPEEDSPEVLADYARKMGIGPGWSLLTGDPHDIELIRQALGYVDPDPARDADKSNHIGMVRYGNERLERWGASPGAGNPEWLARSILFVDNPVKSDAPRRAALR